MSSPWHRHPCVVPLSPALTAQGHTARHLQGAWQWGENHMAHTYLLLQWFALLCTITGGSCNRFLLATSASLLRLPQVKKAIIQSGELKWPFTVCLSIFLLLRRTSGLLFLPVGSVIRNHFAISSELHNFFSSFVFLPDGNKWIQSINYFSWTHLANTRFAVSMLAECVRVFEIPRVIVGVASRKPQAD